MLSSSTFYTMIKSRVSEYITLNYAKSSFKLYICIMCYAHWRNKLVSLNKQFNISNSKNSFNFELKILIMFIIMV